MDLNNYFRAYHINAKADAANMVAALKEAQECAVNNSFYGIWSELNQIKKRLISDYNLDADGTIGDY